MSDGKRRSSRVVGCYFGTRMLVNTGFGNGWRELCNINYMLLVTSPSYRALPNASVMYRGATHEAFPRVIGWVTWRAI